MSSAKDFSNNIQYCTNPIIAPSAPPLMQIELKSVITATEVISSEEYSYRMVSTTENNDHEEINQAIAHSSIDGLRITAEESYASSVSTNNGVQESRQITQQILHSNNDKLVDVTIRSALSKPVYSKNTPQYDPYVGLPKPQQYDIQEYKSMYDETEYTDHEYKSMYDP
jgi:hypothetical protein